MRIIAGDKRGRALLTPADRTIRPTSDRARGAVFNVLAHNMWGVKLFAAETCVMDGFCGTGALAFEALSRGAGHAVLIDHDTAALHLARQNAAALQLTPRCTFLTAAAPRLPPAPPLPFQLVFLDPPYRKDLLNPTLAVLRQGWLVNGAVLVAESEPGWVPPAEFTVHDIRRYGAAQVAFLLCKSA